VIENMQVIRADPALSRAVRYVVVDEGWEHLNGEWFPNYKFPGGLEHLAHEIARRGFVPGIWTSPVMVNTTSKTALRDYQMLVRDQYGDPEVVYGHYLVDPTHPQGAAFLRELYTRLYRAGFRFFKVDYVDALLQAGRFHDPTKGPYEVLRDLFALIRACVTERSHILGCSLPQECGPGCADSLRSGIDIHNQWTHVEWAADYMQLGYWWHERIAVADPDFLIVRGRDTSPDAETNVLNPKAHHPDPPRWRRGPVFTLDEARTWATLVHMSGGSVFLSDRLCALNDAGREVIAEALHPIGIASRPLDLGEGERASLWFAQGDVCHLAVINWTDQPQTRTIDLAAWGIVAPDTLREVWSGKTLHVRDGRLTTSLAPHASALFHWE
jgi:hypothetical protein